MIGKPYLHLIAVLALSQIGYGQGTVPPAEIFPDTAFENSPGPIFEDSTRLTSPLIETARLLIDGRQDYDSAIIVLENYIPQDSLNSEAWYLLGFANDRKDRLPLAIEYYHKAIALDSSYSGPWRDMAYLFDIFAQYDSMNIYMRHAVELDPAPAALYYDFGYSFDMLNQDDSALAYYHRALEADPLDGEACLNIGAVWGTRGNLDSAKFYTIKSLEINPNISQACYNYGAILMADERPAEAVDYFQKALALDPSMVAVNMKLGELYETLGDSNMARLYFQDFIDTAPIIYLDDINRAKAKLESYPVALPDSL